MNLTFVVISSTLVKQGVVVGPSNIQLFQFSLIIVLEIHALHTYIQILIRLDFPLKPCFTSIWHTGIMNNNYCWLDVRGTLSKITFNNV